MEKLQTYFRRILPILLSFSAFSCQQESWYSKKYTEAEKEKLSRQLLASDGKQYYQGSVPEQYVLEEALQLDPKHAAAWRELGAAPLKRGFPKEAMAAYAKAVEYDPEGWQGWRGYLYLYFYRDYEKAIADFNATDTITPDVTDYPQGQSVDYMRGLCYYGLNDFQTALEYFSRYIEEVTADPGESWVDPYAFLYRGLTYEKLNRVDLALLDFDKGLKNYPMLSDCFYHQARLHLASGSYEKALTLINEARLHFVDGFYHQRPYVEVQDQIYVEDIERLEEEILLKIKNGNKKIVARN